MHDLLTLGDLYHDLKRGKPGSGDHRPEAEIHDELYAVASASVALRAQSLAELAVKAELLLDYADPIAADIVAQLLQSLCRDLIALAMPAGRPAE